MKLATLAGPRNVRASRVVGPLGVYRAGRDYSIVHRPSGRRLPTGRLGEMNDAVDLARAVRNELDDATIIRAHRDNAARRRLLATVSACERALLIRIFRRPVR